MIVSNSTILENNTCINKGKKMKNQCLGFYKDENITFGFKLFILFPHIIHGVILKGRGGQPPLTLVVENYVKTTINFFICDCNAKSVGACNTLMKMAFSRPFQ
jgi:hypothetical protein